MAATILTSPYHGTQSHAANVLWALQTFTTATVLRRITIPSHLHTALTVAATRVGAAAIGSTRAVHARSLAAPLIVGVTLKAAAAVLCPIFFADPVITMTTYRIATGLWHAGGALACHGDPVTVVHAVVAAFGDVAAFEPGTLATTVLLRCSIDPYVVTSEAVHTFVVLLWTARGRDAEQGAAAAGVLIVVWLAGFPYHGLTCG